MAIGATAKDDILDEIRRTTQENGGTPLGFRRFQEITGISQYAWGRYWARFTEAQREAGFTPNERNGSLDPAFVMLKYIGLMRELNRVPTQRELRVQRSRDDTFPDLKTFQRKGSKNELIGRALEFCRGKSEYADIAALCEAVYQTGVDVAEEQSDRATTAGFVYLAKGHGREYKIGRTNLVDRRLSELGATASVELALIHEIKTDDPVGVEAYWHRRFSDQRLRGEWFKLSASDVAAFKRWRRIL